MITRLTTFVSGNVQRVGYRARVTDIANAFGLKGMIENQKDGLVKIIAEGEEERLRWFESAINIKNALIRVSSIEKEYSQASGDFESFGKLVLKGETDSRLDTAAEYLKDLVVGVNKINENLGGLGGKMDRMIDQQDQMLDKQDQMLDKQDTTIGEIQALRTDLKGYMDMRFKRIEADLSELKDMKVALKEKGLI
ncbi:MAG: acylphosphatase [Methanothrix sp.]